MAAQAEQTAVMTEEEIAAAARAAEEAAARQIAALEQSIKDLLDKRAAIMADFSALIQAYNDQQINDLTVTVSPVKVYTSKLLSGAFLKQALKTAGPFCAVGLMVCLVLVILSRRAEDKQKR